MAKPCSLLDQGLRAEKKEDKSNLRWSLPSPVAEDAMLPEFSGIRRGFSPETVRLGH